MTAADEVHDALKSIERGVTLIEAHYEWGGWPGSDDDAKIAAALANRLSGMCTAVALGGRAYAEGDESDTSLSLLTCEEADAITLAVTERLEAA